MLVPGDWRRAVDPGQVEEKLAADPGHRIQAVTIVQNETSTGAASQIPPIRAAIDRAAASRTADRRHDLLAGLGRLPARRMGRRRHHLVLAEGHDAAPRAWALTRSAQKALDASRRARLPRSYWAWPPLLDAAVTGLFPYTPATNLLFGLREALAMFERGGPARRLRPARPAR